MQVLHIVIQWVAVPVILVFLLCAAALIAGRQAEREARQASRAGFWAGLGGAAIIVLLLPRGQDVRWLAFVPLDPALGPNGVVVGVAAGVGLPFAYVHLRDSKGVGLVAGYLSGSAVLSLAAYAFLPSSRPFLVPFALAVAVTIFIGAAAVTRAAFERPLMRQP